jgi:hypothetical protein
MAATQYSYRQYPGNGSTTSFAVPFPYLLKAHVHVYLGFNLLDGTFTSELAETTGYTWTSGTQIQTVAAPATGQTLTVIRQTPNSQQLVEWQDGSTLISEDLNTSDKQNLYVIQEQQDRNDSAITGLGASASAASASAASASASAANAATQATAAIASADAATAAATAVTTTANAASSAANAAVQIATAAATPQSPIQVLEPLQVLVNAAFSVGSPGAIPFGVGPVLTPGAAFSGISQSDYYPIHHASGSFC